VTGVIKNLEKLSVNIETGGLDPGLTEPDLEPRVPYASSSMHTTAIAAAKDCSSSNKWWELEEESEEEEEIFDMPGRRGNREKEKSLTRRRPPPDIKTAQSPAVSPGLGAVRAVQRHSGGAAQSLSSQSPGLRALGRSGALGERRHSAESPMGRHSRPTEASPSNASSQKSVKSVLSPELNTTRSDFIEEYADYLDMSEPILSMQRSSSRDKLPEKSRQPTAEELVIGKRRPLARARGGTGSSHASSPQQSPESGSSSVMARRASPSEFDQAFRKAGKASPVMSYTAASKNAGEARGRVQMAWDTDSDSDE